MKKYRHKMGNKCLYKQINEVCSLLNRVGDDVLIERIEKNVFSSPYWTKVNNIVFINEAFLENFL